MTSGRGRPVRSSARSQPDACLVLRVERPVRAHRLPFLRVVWRIAPIKGSTALTVRAAGV